MAYEHEQLKAIENIGNQLSNISKHLYESNLMLVDIVKILSNINDGIGKIEDSIDTFPAPSFDIPTITVQGNTVIPVWVEGYCKTE